MKSVQVMEVVILKKRGACPRENEQSTIISGTALYFPQRQVYYRTNREGEMKILSILILTVGLVFGAYCSENVPDIKERVEKLADLILEGTPKDLKADWVVLEDIKDNPEILNAAVLKKIMKKYKVYKDRKNIPSKYKIFDSKELVVYGGGFYFNYEIIGDLKGESIHLKVGYQWDGRTASSLGEQRFYERIYEWNGKEWIDMFKNSKKATSYPENKAAG